MLRGLRCLLSAASNPAAATAAALLSASTRAASSTREREMGGLSTADSHVMTDGSFRKPSGSTVVGMPWPSLLAGSRGDPG